ncbi:MAG TPA: hypothetical protein V6C58_02855 [Allocoleopsis sp.]
MKNTTWYAVECIANGKRRYWGDYYRTLALARNDARQLARDNPGASIHIYKEKTQQGAIGAQWQTVEVQA